MLKRQYAEKVMVQESERLQRMAQYAEEAMQQAAHGRAELSRQQAEEDHLWTSQVQQRHSHFEHKWDRMNQAKLQYQKRRSDALAASYMVNHPEFGQIDIRQARSAGTLGANIALSFTPTRKHRSLTPIGKVFPLQGKHATMGAVSPAFDRQFMATASSAP